MFILLTVLYWEKVLNFSISSDRLENVSHNVCRTSSSLFLCFFQNKNLHRYYWTPQRLHNTGLAAHSMCWKYDGSNANLSRIVFEYQSISIFWKESCGVLSKTIRKGVFPMSSLCVLDIQDPPCSSNARNWIAAAHIVAKKRVIL